MHLLREDMTPAISSTKSKGLALRKAVRNSQKQGVKNVVKAIEVK
jgi:hypothetical protein